MTFLLHGLWFSILCLAFAAHSAHGAQRLKGDPRAVETVERMLERLGGRDVWARTRSLHLDYRVWRTDPDEHLTELAWRDLAEPNQRIELRSPSAPIVWAFTLRSGWAVRDGEVKDISAKGHASAVAFWPFDFYTMFRRFAVGDQEIVLGFIPPRRVTVKSTGGADWGWWEIDSTGALIKWGAADGEEKLEYVYGPLRSFGDITFPAWGAAVDGSWRFEYAAVSVSTEPIPASLLAKPQGAGLKR